MDDTQRNILGALGALALISGIGLLVAADYLPGIILTAGGLLALLMGFRANSRSIQVMSLTDRRGDLRQNLTMYDFKDTWQP